MNNRSIVKVASQNKKVEIHTGDVLHYCCTHGGKMEGIPSLSSSCTNNARCLERIASGDTICAACFAFAQMARYANMIPCYENNTRILSEVMLSEDDIPTIESDKFRIESFGDLNNAIQARNYWLHALMNPTVKVAWWTKSPDFIAQAIEMFGLVKPSNLVIIYSSPRENMPVNIHDIRTLYPFIDKVFTVYTKEYLANHPEVVINCGARNCDGCGRCYSHDTEEYINEIKK